MRDLAVFVILSSFVGLAIYRPWLGVIGLAVLSAMQPQAYAGPQMASFPVYKVLFLATCLGAALQYWRDRHWPVFFWDWRFAVVALLGLDFVITTHFALLPLTSRDKLYESIGLILPWLPMLLLIDTREKLSYVVVATAMSIALIALKGGFWAVMTGFQDRVYGPPGSQISGNNEFAVALAMTIPLLVLWLRQVRDKSARLVIMALIALCYVSALTSWSRGGLVSLAAMTALLIWHSRRKYLAIPLLALGVALAFMNLPEKWHARMGTLATYEQDQSFQGRVWVWQRGLDYVRTDPLTGTGMDGWKQVNVHESERPGASAWHNAFVQILVEHGIPGFALWATLVFGTMASLTLLIRRGQRMRSPWISDFGAMLRASLVAYVMGGLTLGIAYWDLLYLILGFTLIARRLSRTPKL